MIIWRNSLTLLNGSETGLGKHPGVLVYTESFRLNDKQKILKLDKVTTPADPDKNVDLNYEALSVV